jgi:hypothetical protein
VINAVGRDSAYRGNMGDIEDAIVLGGFGVE